MRPRLAVLLLLTAVRAARRPFVPKECGDVCHHGKCLFQGCRDAPNCELMAWPEHDPARGIEPKALFLVAKHDVPASVELVRGC